MPSTPRALLAHSQKGSGFTSKASNRSLDELASLRLRDIEEAQTKRLSSIAQRAFRGQVLDLLLLAERGTRTVIHGVDAQQFEHVRIIVHGSRPKCWEQRLWPPFYI
jgi:hypothetical protein